MTKSIESAILIEERAPVNKLYFQVFPETITDSKRVNWADISVIGRSEPIKAYATSGPRQFNFVMGFVASVDEADGGTADYVKRKINILQSFAYPQMTESGFVLFPPVLLLIVGDLINSRCVLREISVDYVGPWTLEVRQEAYTRPGGVPRDRAPIRRLGGSEIYLEPDVKVEIPYYSLPMVSQVSVSLEEVNESPHVASYVRAGRREV